VQGRTGKQNRIERETAHHANRHESIFAVIRVMRSFLSAYRDAQAQANRINGRPASGEPQLWMARV